jgi:hypothetical protein
MPFFGIPIRNGLPIGLGSAAGFGIAPFSPASLFENGEQGVWYDPSDYTTLFQDSAGTTPVTAVEQPVGLILDKSKGLTLGSELVSNGDFSNGGTGWYVGGGWTVSSGAASTAASFTDVLYQDITVVAGRTYQVAFDLSGVSGGGVLPSLYGGTTVFGPTLTAEQRHVIHLVAASGNTALRFFKSFSSAAFTLDNISVRELPGNHASQGTSASRPVLSARYNLLTRTEEFDNAPWTAYNATASGNQTTAPNGTSTADRIIEAAGVALQSRYQAVAGTVNVAHTLSVYAKKAERDFVNISFAGPPNNWFAATFDLANGTVSKTGAGASGAYTSSSIQNMGNGWYLCSVTGLTNSSGTQYVYVGPSDTGTPTYGVYGVLNYTGDITKGIYIWGADLRVSNDGIGLPAYQRIAAATDYDTTGFPYYLRFDGTDDSLSTASIDFSSTDKMSVFAGVRKLNSATSVVVSTSNNAESNNGAFRIVTDAAGYEYLAGSRGTTFQQALVDAAAYASPVTNVLTLLSSISGPSINFRINGALISSDTASQGTGNYGNYALHIGQRGDATQQFNGRLYSLIGLGRTATDAEIASTETWINQKTRAY